MIEFPNFRAWRASIRIMVNVSKLFWETDENEQDKLFVNWWYVTNNSYVSSGDYVDDEFILMQSLNIKDVNGQEIFEGDIVKIERFIDSIIHATTIIGVVKKHKDCWVVSTGDRAYSVYSEKGTTEVLGNRYETPDWRDTRDYENIKKEI